MTQQLAPIEPQNARERELRDRAVRDYAAFQAVGLETGATFFAPGTEVGSLWAKDIAKGKIARARRDFERLPEAQDALTALQDNVLAEDRQDRVVTFGGQGSNLYPTIAGGWSYGADRYAPTEQAMASLMAKRPEALKGLVPAADITAWVWQAEPSNVVLRNRKLPVDRKGLYPGGTREAYAVVSEKYEPYDLDAAAADLAKVVPSGARARVRYDGQRATVDIILQNPYKLDGADGAAVGEAHRVALRMRTADDGTGGYHISLWGERVRCVNLTLLHAKKALFSGTHRQDNLRDLAAQALDQVDSILHDFAQRWAQGWQDYYVDKYTGRVTGEEAIKRIVSWGKYRIPGLRKEGTLDACLAALAEEPGDSKIHVHNALTRAAHQAPVTWQTRWADDSAEEQASALLYQKVSWLPEVPDAPEAN